METTPKELIETPALLIDLDSLEFNIERMASFMKGKRARLRPHYKTHKCPAIARLQIAAGAKGMCCAKLGEAETLVEAGIDDILIANQIVDQAKISRLAALARGGARLTVAADNPDNVKSLSVAAAEQGATIRVLVEVNVGMNRCGVDTADEVLALAELAGGADGLEFEGIQAYEGHVVLEKNVEARRRGVAAMIDKVTRIVEYLEKKGVRVNEISGGGTGTYAITGDNTIWTEIQAGSYVFMDTTYNGLGLGFRSALTVYATVIHKRKGMAVTDAGMKACSTDCGLPSVLGHDDLRVRLHEEHGLVDDTGDCLEYGQKIEYVPSHCCTTVNLHDTYFCIRSGMVEATWPISGRGTFR